MKVTLPSILYFLNREISAETPFVILTGGLLIILCLFIYRYFRVRPSAKRQRKSALNAMIVINKIPLAPQKMAYLRKINPFAFEELLLNAFEARKIPIKRNKRYTNDGGIDGQVCLNNQWVLIQAKRYSKAINPDHVREFIQLCAREQKNGLFVHTGRTGEKSKECISNVATVQLISGELLLQLIAGLPIQIFGKSH